MTTNIVATITGNGAALTAEINKTFGAIPGIAKGVGRELGNLFDTEFEKGTRKAETAARASARSIADIVKSATVTNGAIQFDTAGIRSTIAARNQELQVMEALLAAKQRLAAKESDASRETQVYLATLRQSVNEERQAIAALTSKAQVLDNLQAELGQTAVQQNRVNAVSGQARAGMQQLSFQISDVAASFASGVNPMVIFGQQAGQVVQAVSMMQKTSGGFIGFLAGPWGAALTGAAILLGSLWAAHEKASDSAEKQGKKEKTLTERIYEQNEALQRNIQLQGQRQAFDLASANSSFTSANNAVINLRTQIADMQKQLSIYEQQAARGERGYSGPISDLKAQIATARADLAKFEAAQRAAGEAVKAASITIADRKIAGQFDKQIAETNRYEDALAKLNEQVIAGTISLAERNKRATQELALHEKNKKAIEESTKAQRESNREASRLPDVTGSEVARLIGAPITSGKRTAAQNKKAGGAANSYHLIDQAIDIPLTVNGKPLTKEGIRAALEPAGIVIKELLGPGDKGHSDHFHVAFARRRATADKIASEAAADAKKAQQELATALSNVTRLFDPAAEAAAQYRLQLQEIKKLEDAGVAGGGISAEDAKRYRDELAESHAAKLDAIEDARHAKFLGNMSKEFQLASELSGDVAEEMVSDYLETTQAAEEKILQQRQESIDRQRDEFLDLADFYQRAFETGGRSIWSSFKQMGRRVLAELAAQATISILGGGATASGSGGLFSNIFGNGASGISSLLGGGASAGSGLAGLTSAAGPVSAGIALNQGIASLLGNKQIKNGMLASLIVGPILTKLFGSAKRGSATLAFTNGSLGVGATRGNSGSRISAAKDGIGSLADTLEQIAEALGGTISGAGSVSLGIRKKTYVVDPTGQGRTKGSGVLKFKDEQDAIEAAMRDALQDGVIDGISAASKKILASGQDLQKAIQKAALIESIPKALKARLNPVGAALDELNEKWDKTIAALKEGGATAEQMAEAEKLYRIERQDALTAANDNLKEFINSLNFGSSSTYSLIDQSKAARAELDQYLGKINSGNFAEVDQQKYLAAAQAFLEIQRELGGSGTGWFNSVDELRTATQRLADGLAQGTNSAAAARDPFAELTATSTQATAEILAQQSAMLMNIESYLAALANGTVAGSSFIGANRSYLAAAV